MVMFMMVEMLKELSVLSLMGQEGFTCHQEVWTAPEKASHAKEQVKSWKRGGS